MSFEITRAASPIPWLRQEKSDSQESSPRAQEIIKQLGEEMAEMEALQECSFAVGPFPSSPLSMITSIAQRALDLPPTLDCRIPVVDMNNLDLDVLYRAMTTVGFFAVRNTSINQEVIDTAYTQMRTFFKQPEEEKLKSFNPAIAGQRGFVPAMETAQGATIRDRKEFVHIGREGGDPPNIWPEQEGFREAMNAAYVELMGYVRPLQRVIVAAINQHTQADIPLDLLNDEIEGGPSLLRVLYYPALSGEEMGIGWAAPHTDIDNLALIPRATARGLQVEIDGEWLNVVAPDDAIIVNVGDFLQNRTNLLFRSARHRVVAQESGEDRFTLVLFVHPHDETSLAPLPSCIKASWGIQRCGAETRKEALWARLIELNLAPNLLEPYSKTGHIERQMEYGRHSLKVAEMLIEQNLASPELRDFLKMRTRF